CLPACVVSDSSSRRISSRCSSVRCTGVSTTTRQKRSPRAPPRTGFTPLSRRRKTRPDWVSGGIFSCTSPPSVGTATAPPSAAVAKLTGTSQERCAPSRSKVGCSRTWSTTYRAPGRAPSGAAAARAAQAVPEHTPEDVAEGVGADSAARSSRAATRLDTGGTVLIVGRALVRVGEHLAGFLRLLEGLLRVPIVGVAVGVILH